MSAKNQSTELSNLDDRSFSKKLEGLIQMKFKKKSLSSDLERKPKADKGI